MCGKGLETAPRNSEINTGVKCLVFVIKDSYLRNQLFIGLQWPICGGRSMFGFNGSVHFSYSFGGSLNYVLSSGAGALQGLPAERRCSTRSTSVGQQNSQVACGGREEEPPSPLCSVSLTPHCK